MPADTATPPAVPSTAVAPTPAGEYKLSQNAPLPTRTNNPDLAAALAKRAGSPPADAQQGEAKVIPAQPPRPPAAPAADALATTDASTAKPADASTKPPPAADASKAKFVAPDDVDAPPAADTAKPPATRPPDLTDEEVKSAPAKLRESYARVKAERDSIMAERDLTRKESAEYRARLKGYEDRIKSLESADARVKELEKQVLTYDEQLRITNYLQHPEFHEKFVRPVAEAMQSAVALVQDLIVEDAATGTTRTGTNEDFADVLSQPNTTLAARKARELFGDLAPQVVEARQRVRAAQEAQARAVKDAGSKSQEFLQRQSEREAAARTEARAAFDRASRDLEARFPQLYRPPEGDQEALAARQSGEDLARLIVEGRPDTMATDQYLASVAKLYHRAAAFPMRELHITRLQGEVEALRSRLAAYEGSTPDTASRQQPGGAPTTDAGGAIVTQSGQKDYKAMMKASLEKRANRYK